MSAMYWTIAGPSVSRAPVSSSSTGTYPLGLMVQKSAPDFVFFCRLSTCSRSKLAPTSRNTMCGESEHAAGAK